MIRPLDCGGGDFNAPLPSVRPHLLGFCWKALQSSSVFRNCFCLQDRKRSPMSADRFTTWILYLRTFAAVVVELNPTVCACAQIFLFFARKVFILSFSAGVLGIDSCCDVPLALPSKSIRIPSFYTGWFWSSDFPRMFTNGRNFSVIFQTP